MNMNAAISVKKIMVMILTVILLTAVLSFSVHADDGEAIEMPENASITISGLEPGTTVNFYRIASMSGTTQDIRYALEADFMDLGNDALDLLESQSGLQNLAYMAAEYVDSSGSIIPSYTKNVDDNSEVSVDVSSGVYLIMPKAGVEMAVAPFIVMAPTLDTSTNSWIYDVIPAIKGGGSGGLPGGLGSSRNLSGRGTALKGIVAVFRGFETSPQNAVLEIETVYGTRTATLNAANSFRYLFPDELYASDIYNISIVSIYGYSESDYDVQYELSGDMILAGISAGPPSVIPFSTGVSSDNSRKLFTAKVMMNPTELMRTASDKTPAFIFGSIGAAAVLAGIVIIRKKSVKN